MNGPKPTHQLTATNTNSFDKFAIPTWSHLPELGFWSHGFHDWHLENTFFLLQLSNTLLLTRKACKQKCMNQERQKHSTAQSFSNSEAVVRQEGRFPPCLPICWRVFGQDTGFRHCLWTPVFGSHSVCGCVCGWGCDCKAFWAFKEGSKALYRYTPFVISEFVTRFDLRPLSHLTQLCSSNFARVFHKIRPQLVKPRESGRFEHFPVLVSS